MLTLELRELEGARLVLRTVYPEVPVRVVYELTEEGRSLQALVDMLGEVGERLEKLRQTSDAKPCEQCA
jgi:DNA-binding HxlR family transcriptional regulator